MAGSAQISKQPRRVLERTIDLIKSNSEKGFHREEGGIVRQQRSRRPNKKNIKKFINNNKN